MREKLVSLEIPFVQHTCNRGSSKRQLLVDKYGKFAVPYLEVSLLLLGLSYVMKRGLNFVCVAVMLPNVPIVCQPLRCGRVARLASLDVKVYVWCFRVSDYNVGVYQYYPGFRPYMCRWSCMHYPVLSEDFFSKYVKLHRITGQMLPMQDPNQKVAMFESSDIIKYLDDTYAAA